MAIEINDTPSGDKEMKDYNSQLRSLRRIVAMSPSEDAQRISDVRRALATGTLRLNERKAADNLLAFEIGLSV